MKTGRWFFVLSVLLLAALLCVLGPAACAEGPDSESVFHADLVTLGMHVDEIKTMREDALTDYLSCLFAAEDTDDPEAQEQYLEEAELCWMLYTDLLAVQSKAELAASMQDSFSMEPDPFLSSAQQWPEEAYQPEDGFSYGWDNEWNFEDCPCGGAHHHGDHHGWNDIYDYAGYWYAFPAEYLNESEPVFYEEQPVMAEQADEKAEADMSFEIDAAQPAELSEETDPYAEWSELEELFFQALMEALFGDGAQTAVALPNPWIDAADPDEAAKVSGLRLDVPEALPKDMELQNYRAMEDVTEADYSDGYDELTLRASLNQKGLALTGDYNDYSVQWQEKVGDLVIDCLGDGEKINAAAWTVDGVNYALDMAPGKEGLGLSYDEVSAITAAVSAVPVQTEFKAEPSAEPAVPSDEALEMPFELTEAENLSSEAIEVPAETQPTGGRQTRLIVGGGETYVYYD